MSQAESHYRAKQAADKTRQEAIDMRDEAQEEGDLKGMSEVNKIINCMRDKLIYK